MKKISLLSLVAIAGISYSASAMNMENPLYMPKAGTAFITAEMNYNNMEDKADDQDPATNVAPTVTRTDDFEMGQWEDAFTLGYGFSKQFALTISNADSGNSTTPNYLNTNRGFTSSSFQNPDRSGSPVITGIFRAVKKGTVVLDVVGSMNPSLQANEPMVFGAGIRAGVMTKKMTMAFGGHIGYGMGYDNVDLDTGTDAGEVDDNMAYTLTADFQFNLNKNMSFNLGAEYTIIDELEYTATNGAKTKIGEITGYDVELGLNIQTKKMLITPYIAMADYEQDDLDNGGNDVSAISGMSYGVRFGLEF